MSLHRAQWSRWGKASALLSSLTLLGYAHLLYFYDLPLIPWLSWLLGAWTTIYLGMGTTRAPAVDRALFVAFVLSVLSHLQALGAFQASLPEGRLVYLSRLSGAYGSTLQGFPLRALLGLVGVLAWSRLIAAPFKRPAVQWLVGVPFGALGISSLLCYATGSPWLWTA